MLTEEELKEILGDIHVSFHRYYKYSFYYRGEPEKYYHDEENNIYYIYRIQTEYGRNHDDIYRYEVNVFHPEPLFPLSMWTAVKIERRNTREETWETVYEADNY